MIATVFDEDIGQLNVRAGPMGRRAPARGPGLFAKMRTAAAAVPPAPVFQGTATATANAPPPPPPPPSGGSFNPFGTPQERAHATNAPSILSPGRLLAATPPTLHAGGFTKAKKPPLRGGFTKEKERPYPVDRPGAGGARRATALPSYGEQASAPMDRVMPVRMPSTPTPVQPTEPELVPVQPMVIPPGPSPVAAPSFAADPGNVWPDSPADAPVATAAAEPEQSQGGVSKVVIVGGLAAAAFIAWKFLRRRK